MRILTVSLTRPGHVLHTVIDWWKSRGHEVVDIRLEAGYLRELVGWRIPPGRFDVAITAEPLSLLRLSTTPRISKLIFWRIDLREDFSHKSVDKACMSRADEVWSITKESGRGTHVPAMLKNSEIIQAGRRTNLALWVGPSLDGAYTLVTEKLSSRINILHCNWKEPMEAVSETDLNSALSISKIGLALYDPSKKRKLHSDPFRVKRYLGAGLPVVMSGDFPFAWEVAGNGAGVYCLLEKKSLKAGMEFCLDYFDKMSENAYRLAEKFIISERWVKIG